MLSISAIFATICLDHWLADRAPYITDGGCRLCCRCPFGGLSVYFDNEIFIKVKPTILTGLWHFSLPVVG